MIVYWPGADGSKWHHGQVKDIDDNGRSVVAYDDGDREMLYFAMERFKLEEATPPPGVPFSSSVIATVSGTIQVHVSVCSVTLTAAFVKPKQLCDNEPSHAMSTWSSGRQAQIHNQFLKNL